MVPPAAPMRITITAVTAFATVRSFAIGLEVAAAEIRLRLAAGDERRQAVDVAIVWRRRGLRLVAIVAPVLLTRLLLISRLVRLGLGFADRIRLRFAGGCSWVAAEA